MEEIKLIEHNIKNVFKENMLAFANKEAKGDKAVEAKIIGYFTNFIVMSEFATDLASLIIAGELVNPDPNEDVQDEQ